MREMTSLKAMVCLCKIKKQILLSGVESYNYSFYFLFLSFRGCQSSSCGRWKHRPNVFVPLQLQCGQYSFGLVLFLFVFTVYTERLLIFLQETLLDLLFCVEGLDEISAEKETLVKERKAAAKAAAESRKALKDEDEDYEPKASPGCLLALTVYLLLPFWCQ